MRASTKVRTIGLAAAGGLVLAGLAATTPAQAGHSPLPARVTLMGSLMSELGCAEDWDTACTATDLPRVGESTVFSRVFTVPAGSYELKVRLNGSWDENYGDTDGSYDADGNIPLPLTAPASLRISYDHSSHDVTVSPAAAPAPLSSADAALAADSLRTDLTRERFYFVMADRFANGSTGNDRGGISGTRLQHGFDPTDKAFFHGGDLAGMLGKLDYIQGLGTTAIWMTPSFANKPVQGSIGQESAGYHGYWVTDFTRIDPHLGTNADLKTLIDAAHARGIKVFFDIITNHTADVLTYPATAYSGLPIAQSVPYKSKAARPYTDAAGRPFDDADYALGETFPEIDVKTSFPYEPVVPSGQENAKTPAWLNDPRMYHNRGTSTFAGENSTYGDFPSGNRSELDDLWTERPEVVHGMEDIYKTWVREAGIDGFRIDTVKHVNLEFWQRFGPALQGYAASIGNDDFFMFGEVYDGNPEVLSTYTTAGKLQSTVDFGFQAGAQSFASGGKATRLSELFGGDDWFTDADSNVYSLPTFLGNHDMGRIGMFLARSASGQALLERDAMAHALMYTSRGQPVVYYGDEQGFTGDGGDQDARQDMFPSQVVTYNDDRNIGTSASTASSNFDTTHPLYRTIADLAALRAAHPALADGAQLERYADDGPGVYAFSRISAGQNREYVVAANSADTARSVLVPTYGSKQKFASVWPKGSGLEPRADKEGLLPVTVPARSVVVLRASSPLKKTPGALAVSVSAPSVGGLVEGRTPITATLATPGFAQVTVAARRVGETTWQTLGTDDAAPYRVHHDVSALPKGAIFEYRVVAKEHDGDLAVASTWAVVGKPPVVVPPVGPVPQPTAVSVPGSHGSEVGCTGGDWQPDCAQLQLALDPADQIWKTTLTPPPGGYAFKAAINKAWDENYGVGGARNGGDIGYTATSAPVKFFYDHRTHWVTNTTLDDVFVATGSFQSEMGCPTDEDPACMRVWLQDPDGDKVYRLGVTDIPAGTYSVQVARNSALEGARQSFTVGAGQSVTFVYDPASQSLTVTPG